MSSHETTTPTNHSNSSSSQPPQQAGRFKPRKAATLKTSSSGRGLSAASNSTSPGISVNATEESNHKQAKQQEQVKTQGRQRHSKGGRGGTRGSTNSTPKGQVFFTGTAKTNPSSNRSKPKNVPSSVNSGNMESMGVVLPAFDSTLGKYSMDTGNVIGHTAQERMLASALARRGEGEEVIVGTLDGDHQNIEYDSDGDHHSHQKKKKGDDVLHSTQTSSSRNKDYDVSNHNDDYYHTNMNTNHEYDYTYDSDSSEQYDDEQESSAFHPQRLPFPPPRSIGTHTLEHLYACQTNYDMKSSEKGKSPKVIQENFTYTDPPPVAPFRILNNEDDKTEEQSSWMLFKFPTRLPRLAPHCITSNGGKTKVDTSNTATKESTEQLGIAHDNYLSNHNGTSDTYGITNVVPDTVSSSYFHDESTELNHSSSTSRTNNTYSSNHLYDDTLKDASTGRYGKIVVHKSGKAYLVVGGTDSKTPQVRMLLQNGLSCGFLQQAVSIRTATDGGSGSYTPLGEVHKTIVVTPDVESAFS